MVIAPTSTGFLEDDEGLYIIKDPGARKDYKIDWSPWLDGETIVEASWDVDPDMPVENEGNTPTHTFIEVSGGTLGKAHVCASHIKTNTNRENEMSFRVVVRDE